MYVIFVNAHVMNLIGLFQGCIFALPLIVGLWILASVPADNHRHSTNIYLILALGFVHQMLSTLHWLKESFDMEIMRISPLVDDVYTVPTLLFIMCLFIVSCSFHPYSASKGNVATVVLYISTSLCLLVAAFLIGLFNSGGLESNPNLHAANETDGTSLLQNSIPSAATNETSWTSVLQNIIPNAPYVLMEYTLVYVPTSLFLCLWCLKGWRISTEETLPSTVCLMCEENRHLCKHLTITFYIVIWVVRPVFWVVTSFFHFMTDDIVPSMTIFTVYVYLLWYYFTMKKENTNINVKNQDLCADDNENKE